MSTYRRSYATFITLLLALVLALGALSVPSKVYADDEGGSFALAAIDSEGTIIEPYLVEFDEGDSIKDALKKSGHNFNGIDNDWITSIDGHVDEYMRVYDGGQSWILLICIAIRFIALSQKTNPWTVMIWRFV